MSSGTLSYKVSALTLSIQESPIHNQKAFETLVNLAGKKSRGQAIAALGAIVDLLGNGTVLPNDRRLRAFDAQPALLASLLESPGSVWSKGKPLPDKLTEVHLMMWAYEDWLKAIYFRIIQLLELWSSDEIEYSRTRALDFIFGLLRSKPEQEANLLRLLVNKLGDRERKIASRASYLILQLLDSHPGMKTVVMNTVEQEVLLKPGQNLRARYYAINTLNQTILSSREPAVANNLLRIYFDVFLSLLKSGLLGSLETPAVERDSGGREKHRKKKPKDHHADASSRDETTQKLVSSLLTGVNRAIPFTSTDDFTLEKHLDTLFRITHSSNFNTSVQALMLIQQLAASKHLAVERFYRTLYESLLDPRLITSSKQALYLNLLFRAIKSDADVRRVKAFVKRLVQILGLHQPSFTCGILFLIVELEAIFPDLHSLLSVPETDGEDGEERFRDVVEHGQNMPDAANRAATRHPTAYDGRKRDPEHSNAHRSCLWEIVSLEPYQQRLRRASIDRLYQIPFLNHFHPSVGVFAANLLNRQNQLSKPDLANHTLIHFLDKFVYRNPKATEGTRGGSIMQPVLSSGSASHIVILNKISARQQPTVNSASFWKKKPEDILADDVFFHEYFARLGKPHETPKARRVATDGDNSDAEEAEEEIWEALVNSQPDVEGEGDDDDMLDVDMDDDESDEDLGDPSDHELSDVRSGASEEDGSFEGIFDDSDASDDLGDDEVVEAAQTAGQSQKRLSRSEMRSLPTFASAEDYADMLAGDDAGLDDN